MQVRLLSISFLAAMILTSVTETAVAGTCLKDTREIKVDKANVVRLSGYLCTSDQDSQSRVHVQFQRLSGLAPGVVLKGGSAPWLSSLYGNFHLVNNEVLKEYETLIKRFGFAVREVDQGGGERNYLRLLAGTIARVATSDELETAHGRIGQIVRSFQLAPLPDIPLVDETLQILNEQSWPASLNMSYAAQEGKNRSPMEEMLLWRYLKPDDASQYSDRLRRYNALVVERIDQRKALPRSMNLLTYLTAAGWPETFLYTSASGDNCGSSFDFTVNQPSFEVEVAVIENFSSKPKSISQLWGQRIAATNLRLAAQLSITGDEVLPGEPVMLAPSSKLIVPLRLVFAAGDDSITRKAKAEARRGAEETFRKILARAPGTVFTGNLYSAMRGKTKGREKDTFAIRKVRESFKPPSYPKESDFAFGPEWTLKGLTIGGEKMTFLATLPNVIQITASTGVGSCPILYSWDADAATWIRHGKVLHQAQTSAGEASETVQFDGLIHRFRIAEEELERATIRDASLQIEFNDGRKLTLQPERQLAARPGQRAANLIAELYANDEIEIKFALPVDIDAAQVIRSSLTVAGYYDRYAAQLISAAMTRARLDGN